MNDIAHISTATATAIALCAPLVASIAKPQRGIEASMLPKGDRQDLIKSIVLTHDRLVDTVAMIKRCHYPVKGGVRNYGKFAALIGDSRVGKSFAIARYAARFPQQQTDEGIKKPVIVATAPIGGGMRPLADAIAAAMGLHYSQRLNTIGIMNAVVDVLPKIGCELLIIDEFQEVADVRFPKRLADVRGFLRRIVDNCKVSVILAGLPTTYGLIATDPQLIGRGNLPCFRIPAYDWDNPSDREGFRALCGTIDALLPFPEMAGLEDARLASRLVTVTGGLMGRIMDYVYEAACLAMNEDAPKILPRHFAEYRDLLTTPEDNSNPFVELC